MGGYYFSSNRNNNHYAIDKTGKMQEISRPKQLQDVNAGHISSMQSKDMYIMM